MANVSWFSSFDRRTFVVSVASLLGFGYLAVKIGQLQLVRGKTYRKQAQQNHSKIYYTVPPRGDIFDAQGTLLASHKKIYRLYFQPAPDTSQDQKSSEIIAKVGKILSLSSETIRAFQESLSAKTRPSLIQLADSLTWEQMGLLENQAFDLPGLLIMERYERTYPFQDLFAHSLGYVGAVSPDDLKRGYQTQLEAIPDLKKGKFGLEQTYDRSLRGELGQVAFDVDTQGHTSLHSQDVIEPQQGQPLWTTLDARLQKKAQELLAHHPEGSCIVMDVRNGEIKALVSYPAFDPMIFQNQIDSKMANELFNSSFNIMMNKTITGLYAPGSTLKPLMALMALEQKIVTPETIVDCHGLTTYGNRKFYCWRKEGHGKMNLSNAIKNSCDVYFYNIGAQMKLTEFTRICKEFGLGQRLQADMPNESTGVVPTANYKRRTVHEDWQLGDSVNSAIGQGFTLITPLQLITYVARFSTNTRVSPMIVRAQEHPTQTSFPSMGRDNEHIALIRQGMFRVLNEDGGTARGSGGIWESAPVKMAGKTGTAQVRGFSNAQRESRQDVASKNRLFNPHGLFVGFAPYDDPKYAVVVILDHEEHGASAASVASPLMRETLKVLENI